MSTGLLPQGDAAASSCIRKYRHLSRISYLFARRVERKGNVMTRVLCPVGADAKGEPLNETFVIEDIKLKAIGSPTEVPTSGTQSNHAALEEAYPKADEFPLRAERGAGRS